MKYESLTKKQLIARVKELEELNKLLLKEKNDYLDSSDNVGSWYFNLKTGRILSNTLKLQSLGFYNKDLDYINSDSFYELIHPDDLPLVLEALEKHISGNTDEFCVEYRMKAKSGAWKWYSDRGKISMYDDEGKPEIISGISYDITTNKSEIDNNDKLSKIDDLTQILNHNGIIYKLRNLIKKDDNVSIAIFDIDNFQKMNSKYSYLICNKLLQQVTKVIKSSIRKQDIVGRYAGQNFMIVFPETNYKEAKELSEKIRLSIQNHVFEPNIKITVSGGVKQYHGEHFNEFIYETDLNLYYAKSSGKNNVK